MTISKGVITNSYMFSNKGHLVTSITTIMCVVYTPIEISCSRVFLLGMDDSYSSLGRYCGSSVPVKYSTGQYMFIKFKSDGSNVFTGFQMMYSSMLKNTGEC